jgi:hypothetical protein
MSYIEGAAVEIDHPADLENDEARPRILQSAAERAGTVSGECRDPEDSTVKPTGRSRADANWSYQ